MRHRALVKRWFAGAALLAIARPALAHGEEILLLPAGNVVALVVVVVAALVLKIGWAARLVAVLVAVVVGAVPYFVPNQHVPYGLAFSERGWFAAGLVPPIAASGLFLLWRRRAARHVT